MNIDRNIPIPELEEGDKNKRISGAKRKYPFGDMAVGDSFLVVGIENYKKAKGAARSFRDRNSFNFDYRITSEGMRIWRIE